MSINRPLKIPNKGLFQWIGHLTNVGSDMMLKIAAAHKLHQLLKPGNLCHPIAAEGRHRIIGEFSFAHVGLYGAIKIIGAQPAVGKCSALDAA